MQQTAPIRRAITLVELLMVITIIVGLLALAVPLTLYFGRSQLAVKSGNQASAAFLETQTMAALMKQVRGLALKRSPNLPPNSPPNWFDQLEEVEVKLLRVPEPNSPNPQWLQYPGYVSTTAGRWVFHSRVASLYEFTSGSPQPSWRSYSLLNLNPPLYQLDDQPPNPPRREQPLYLQVNGQAQIREIVGLPDATLASSPPSPPSPPPPPPQPPTAPPPNEANDWVWDPNNPGARWQAAVSGEQPILQAHQVLISHSMSQLHLQLPLQPPNPSQGQFLTNYQIYSLCPMPRNYQPGTNPPQFSPPIYTLPANTAIDLSRSIPNQYPPNPPAPGAYYPSGTPIIVFDNNRSVVIPGAAFLQDKTVNGWIVLWAGVYRNRAGTPTILPEESVLIGIHTRTGRVATFQVNLDPSRGDWYHYVRIAAEK
jgi:type II secretory pathway pseudopilin PulG